MRRHESLAAAALLLALAALPLRAEDAALDLPLGDPARREKTLAPALDVVTDARTGSPLTPAEVARKLSKASLVFLGESHTSAEFHRVQLQVIRELHRTGRKVLVGLEMFPVAEQPALDLWNGGTLSEEEFVEKSRWYRNWGYHWNYYRDIFLFCRDAKIPLHGVNVPRELVSDVRKKGFDGLTAEQKALLPPKIDAENADHRRLFKAFFDEADSMHAASMPEAMWDGMFRAQCTWDAAMAWNAVAALKKANDPNAVMVVLIGSGHVAYGLGAERQAALWFGAAGLRHPDPRPRREGPAREGPRLVRGLRLGRAEGDRPGLPGPRLLDARPEGRLRRAGRSSTSRRTPSPTPRASRWATSSSRWTGRR